MGYVETMKAGKVRGTDGVTKDLPHNGYVAEEWLLWVNKRASEQSEAPEDKKSRHRVCCEEEKGEAKTATPKRKGGFNLS